MKPGIVLCIGPRAERDRICRWLTANGADPTIIPRWARIIITGNRMIITEVIFDQKRTGGKRARRNSGSWQLYATRQRTIRIRYDLKDTK